MRYRDLASGWRGRNLAAGDKGEVAVEPGDAGCGGTLLRYCNRGHGWRWRHLAGVRGVNRCR